MTDLIRGQIDFIYFVYGLGFILLLPICLYLHRRSRSPLPWILLLLFGATHGLNEWLDLVALSLGTNPVFDVVRLGLLILSFLLLAEFGRAGLVMLRGRGPGRWVLAVLLGLALLGAFAGLPGLRASARYALGLVGALGAAAALWLAAHRAASGRRALQGAALCLAGYAAATGMVVDPAPFLPASWLNTEVFLAATGVPIQLGRGILAASLSACLSLFAVASLAQEKHRRLQKWGRNLMAGTVVSILVLVIAGWFVTQYLGREARQDLTNENEFNRKTIQAALQDKMMGADNLVRAMAGSAWILPALTTNTAQNLQKANAVLDRYSAALPDSLCFLMDSHGLAIASSIRHRPDSQVGHSYSFRPYFQEAVQGTPGRYWALGVTHKELGYFASAPVQDPSGKVVGVVVIKRTLDDVKALFPHWSLVFIIDPRGIVVLANRPEMVYKGLWPLSPEEAEKLIASRQFGPGPFAPFLTQAPVDGGDCRFQGRPYLALRQPLAFQDWSIVILTSPRPIAVARLLGLSTAILSCLVVLSLLTIIGLTIDSTSRLKRSEETLRMQKETSDKILDNIPVMIAFIDAQGKHQWVNQRWEKVLGWSIEETQNRDILADLYPNPEYRECIVDYIAEKRGSWGDFKTMSRGGVVLDTSWANVGLADGSNIGIGIDITERKRAEELLALHVTQTQALLDLHLLAQAPQEQILDFVLEASCTIMQSKFAFIGLVDEAESTMTIHRWSEEAMAQCAMDHKPILYPVSEAGSWGDCIRRRQAVLVNDYQAPHSGKKGLPEGHVPIRRFLAVPVLDAGRVVAAAVVANKAKDYTQDDVSVFTALVNKMWEILKRRQAEEDLRQTRDYLDNLINHANAPIIIWDPSFRITQCNRAFEHFTGYSAQEVIGQKLDLLFPEDRCDESLSKIASTFRGEYWESVEIPILRKDGNIRIALWNSANIHAEDGATVVASIAQGQDITGRKQTEEAFRSLVSQAPMGIFIIQDGKFVVINPGFETITGYHKEELLGQEAECLVIPLCKEVVRMEAIKMLKGESSTPFEFPFTTKSGETRWGIETITITQFEGKRAVLGYFLDVTEHKQLEEQFFQAQKMEAVGRLAGGVAHDFNNILTVIFGYADIMNQALRPQDPLAGYLTKIREATDRAAGLTSQLLAFSRKTILAPQVLNLNDQLAGIEQMLERLIGEDIEIRMVLDPALEPVKADPGQIDQIVMNLAINARDAMPSGGKLTLETANVFFNKAYARRHTDVTSGHYVMLAVTDNGQGMDAETQAHVFEPFFTTKELGRGTGLGLSTAYGIVKQSGGHIGVYSEVGQGTTFKIYLPRVKEAVAAVSEAKPIAKDLHGSETILVVEDEDMLREIIGRSLKIYGYTVLKARHGGEALLLCERHPEPIHLMLTDVVMPKMNGRELADRLAPLRPDMKVLYMSGYTDNAIVHHGVLEADIFFVQKPFRTKKLIEKIREILGESLPKP